MNNDRELLQQALDALKAMQSYAAAENKGLRICDEAIEALRARLAQPEPEELARLEEAMIEAWKPIPQREWQGLTDEDCEEVERWVEFKEDGSGRIPTLKLIRYIEFKLKEKNT